MKIPQSLLDAKDVLEARFERNSAIRRKNKDLRTVAQARRMAIPDGNIESPTGRSVVAGRCAEGRRRRGMPDCTGARGRRKTTRENLKQERGRLAEQVQQSVAGSAALARIMVERAQARIEPAEVFMREYRMFEKAVSLEFRRDVARLPMPQFLTKWFCILEGFGHWGAIERLKETRVVWLDAAVLVLGQYHDPDTGETIDYQAAWRLDAAFRDLHQSIAAVCLIMRQVSPMV